MRCVVPDRAAPQLLPLVMTAAARAGAMGVLLAGSTAAIVALAAGAPGLLYACIYVLALVPGLPLGFALFGSRHGLGWIVGGALGYVLTAVAIWAAIAVHEATAAGFAIGWLSVTAAAWAFSRLLRGDRRVRMQSWTARDTSALLLVLLLVPAIAGPPFAKLGDQDHEGNRYYRAYFTADFVWHMAVTAEIAKFSMPPRNPFLANRPLHYYWTYFLLPGAVSGAGPVSLRSVEDNLKVNAIGTAMLLVSAMFAMAWSVVPRTWPVAAATALAIVASSAEGLYALGRYWLRGVPVAELRDVNIDAISNWWFGGLRVDGIPRCFWWVPQHSMSYVCGLAGLVILTATSGSGSVAAILLAGLALGGAVAFNPFVGGIFSLVWGLTAAVYAVRSSDSIRVLLRHALAAAPVLAALGWCASNRMFEGAPGTLLLGWSGSRAPFATLLLSLGPVLILAAFGVLSQEDSALGGAPVSVRLRLASLAAPGLLVVVSLGLLYFVRLRTDESWVGFRAGQMILVAVPTLIARGFAARPPWSTTAAALAALALVAGLPTTAIDLYNAQDNTNLNPAPFGFAWTKTLDPVHREPLDWLRRTTPRTAIVQQDPHAHDRTTWWVIPMFAQRRMAAGFPPFLVDDPEYHEKSARVVAMYSTTSAAEAWATAHALGIDYIYIEELERASYPQGMDKFDDVRYFAPAFRNAAVTVYRVL